MENNLESYLAVIEAKLGDIPDARRAEFVDEVHAHLHAMVEAKRADGLAEAAAWQNAMSEFGDAEKVGRDLRRQWADSGKMETEGAPLPSRRKLWMFALPIIGCVPVYMLFAWMQSPQNQSSWQTPVIAAIFFCCILIRISFDVRKSGGWKPSTIVGYASVILINASILLDVSGYQGWGGEWRAVGLPLFAIICAPLYFLLHKRELANRPWQFNARFKTSPVAAEQEYRLSSLVGLTMGTTVGCFGLISMGSQFFGLPFALLSCAGVIGVAIIFGRWLIK